MKKDLTEFYVYNAMIDFLYGYEKRRYGYGTLQELLRELSPLSEGGTSNPTVWKEWKRCTVNSLKDTLKTKPSGEAADRKYTEFQAFNAMLDFFINYYKKTLDGDLRTLMEIILNLSEDSADQSSWNNWNNAAKKALKNKDEKFIDKFVEKRLTKLQAFNAMVKFLEGYYKETSLDFLGWVLSGLSFTIDGGTADPAFWDDWENSIKKIFQKCPNEKQWDGILEVSLTELQAFKAMVQFFKDFYEREPDPDILIFFDYLHLLPDGSSESSVIREKWTQCVDEALNEKPGIRKYLILCRG